MTESDGEDADILSALVEAADDESDAFALDDAPPAKRRKNAPLKEQQHTPANDLDIFANGVPAKSKLSGSSFKSMG